MNHKPYFLPQILLKSQESHSKLIDLTNQYSIIGKRKHRNTINDFSINYGIKLPQINRKVQQLNNEYETMKQKTLRDNFNQYEKQMKNKLDQLKVFMSQLNQYNSCCCNFDSIIYQNNIKPRQQFRNVNNKPNSGSKNGKKLIKTFRKYVLVVYFTIFIKHYSSKFTKNRKDRFKKLCLKKGSNNFIENCEEITQIIKEIDLLQIIVNLPKDIKKFQKLKINQEIKIESSTQMHELFPSQFQKKFQQSLNLINLYLKQLRTIILNQDFCAEFCETLSIGTINQSFLLDELLLDQQIEMIDYSQKKEYIKISQGIEKILLTISIFVKYVMERIFFILRDEKYFQQKLIESKEDVNDLDGISSDLQQAYNLMQLTSTILYVLITNIILEYFEENPKLIKKISSNNALNKIIPKKAVIAPYKQQQIGSQVDKNQLIKGIDISDQIDNLLESQEYEDYLGYLVGQIEILIQELWKNVKENNRKIYQEIKQITLKQPLIILDSIKGATKKNGSQSSLSKQSIISSNSNKISKMSLGKLKKKN